MRIVGRTVIVAAGLLLASCSSGPECSADNVVATVKTLAQRALANDFNLQYVFDAAKSKYEVNSIRTVSSDANKCSCKGTVHIVFELNDQLKKVRDTEPQKWQSLISNNYREAQTKEVNVEVTYQAQRTDDKKDVYVEVQGL